MLVGCRWLNSRWTARLKALERRPLVMFHLKFLDLSSRVTFLLGCPSPLSLGPTTFPSENRNLNHSFGSVGWEETQHRDWIHSGKVGGWAAVVLVACISFLNWQFENHPLPSSYFFFTILQT